MVRIVLRPWAALAKDWISASAAGQPLQVERLQCYRQLPHGARTRLMAGLCFIELIVSSHC